MSIRDFFFNNFGLKVTALVLALTTWILIAGKEHAYLEKNFECNVEFYNVSENIDVDSRPEKVRINVRGTSKEINRITPNDFKLKIDLKGITRSTSLSFLVEDFLQISSGIRPEAITIHPRMISITAKEFMSKEVSVRVRYTGSLKPGIILIDRKLIPEKVRIFGYKSEISAIEHVDSAEEIKLGDIDQTKRIKVPLKKIEEILRFENAGEVEVEIVVETRRKNGTGTDR